MPNPPLSPSKPPYSLLSNLLIAFVLLILALIGAIALWHYFVFKAAAREVANYSGDGEIRDRSLSYLYLPLAGYEITFESFPLDQSFSRSYTLDNLPVIGRRPVVYLQIPQQPGISYQQPLGTISLSLTDSSGKAHINFTDVPTEKFIWTYSSNGPYGLYLLDYPTSVSDSTFIVEKGEIYTLRIDFVPTVVPAKEDSRSDKLPDHSAEASATQPADPVNGWLYIRAL